VPGSSEYLESLLASSIAFAPWQGEVLGIPDAGGLRVLDVGCGPGVELVRFARAGADVVGVDLVAVHVEQARAHLAAAGLGGEVSEADGEALPFPDRAFDRVVSANALQFTPDFGRAMREAHRVLRPGGDIRLVVYHRDSVYYWMHFVLTRGVLRGELPRHGSMADVLARNIPWASSGVLPTVRVFSRRSLRRALKEAGFRDVTTSVHGLAPDHFAPAASVVRRFPRTGKREVWDALGTAFGWYVAASAKA
jgi:ubiquinone/menaquinone biosynthesis C-methylase UbiE